MAKTIEEIKKTKTDLELAVIDLFKTFESETDSKIEYIRVRHAKSAKDKKDEKEDGYLCCDYDNKGPVKDVEIELRFDI